MKQVILKKGIVFTEDVPAPLVSDGSILIRTVASCISAGTELSSIQTSEKPLIKRALEQPEKVKKVFNWIKKDGILNTYKQVQNELNVGITLGYSLSGIVIGKGKDVTGFKEGDRVAAAGGSANHAEFVEVPANLVTLVPNNVSFMHASTVAIGAIALQSVRRADLRLGEFAVVIGCGLLGLIVIQILNHSGARLAVTDLNQSKLDLAVELGAELAINPAENDPVRAVQQWSNGHGADAVIFAAATESSEPLSQSFKMCRRKGRVILLGVSGMQIERKDIYEKELDFMVSTSYGPGRYDRTYEEKGIDYPYAYVRWTENRNLGEYIRLISIGHISFDRFTSISFPVTNVSEAYSAVKTSSKDTSIIFLEYPETSIPIEKPVPQSKRARAITADHINIGLVGAGNFARNMHLPNIAKLKNRFHISAVMDKNGYNAKQVAQAAGTAYSTTNFDQLLSDNNIHLIMICTRHDSHASLTLRALQAGKHVFVEKPLATNMSDLEKVKAFLHGSQENKPILVVGYNRRFSPFAQEIKKHTDRRINPLFIHYRVNAGFIPLNHWVHENGGRIVGEACHIIDLMTFFTGCRIATISCESISPTTNIISGSDNKSIILKYEDGSVATIEYFSIGNNNIPKEYMEVHFDNQSIILDDYKSLKGFGLTIEKIKSANNQKGHLEELEELHKSIISDTPEGPIEMWDLIQTTEATIKIQ